jgi:hypothetical protein
MPDFHSMIFLMPLASFILSIRCKKARRDFLVASLSIESFQLCSHGGLMEGGP